MLDELRQTVGNERYCILFEYIIYANATASWRGIHRKERSAAANERPPVACCLLVCAATPATLVRIRAARPPKVSTNKFCGESSADTRARSVSSPNAAAFCTEPIPRNSPDISTSELSSSAAAAAGLASSSAMVPRLALHVLCGRLNELIFESEPAGPATRHPAHTRALAGGRHQHSAPLGGTQ